MILLFFQVFAWTMFKLLVVWLHLRSTQESISYLCMPVIVNKPWWQYKPISFESWYYLFLLRNILYETSLWGLSLGPLFGSSLWDLFLGPIFWHLSLGPLFGAYLRASTSRSTLETYCNRVCSCLFLFNLDHFFEKIRKIWSNSI